MPVVLSKCPEQRIRVHALRAPDMFENLIPPEMRALLMRLTLSNFVGMYSKGKSGELFGKKSNDSVDLFLFWGRVRSGS
jgi:hypothetical protein